MDLKAIFDNFHRTVTEHYFDMNGRVGRSQFWYFVLANIVIAIGLTFVQIAVFLPLVALYNLAMLLPSAGMGARRLQDTGRDGKILWAFIIVAFISQAVAAIMLLGAMSTGLLFLGPALALSWLISLAMLVVSVVLIYFWCQPGDPLPNAYGPPPPMFDPSQRAAMPL
ncbi:MAG: DUF805 domain-containing protein [Alphaproteobacteria bacterium]|nr:DUF805 domain-containing protein [Alphaproteobacteria bacterium]